MILYGRDDVIPTIFIKGDINELGNVITFNNMPRKVFDKLDVVYDELDIPPQYLQITYEGDAFIGTINIKTLSH